MAATQRSDLVDLELRDYLRVLRRQWVLIAVITLIVTALGLGWSLTRTPVYEASARIVLDEGFSKTVLFADQNAVPNLDDQVVTEMDLMRSGSVQQQIEERLGYPPDVDVSREEAADETVPTRTIDVTVTGPDKAKAVTQANDFAKTYVTVRRLLIDDDLTANIDEVATQVEELDVRAADDRARVAELDRLIDITPGARQRFLYEAERARLLEGLDPKVIAEREGAIRDRLAELRAAKESNENRGIFKRTAAKPPAAPISPKPLRDGIIAVLLGLALGIITAFLRDYYDETLRTKDDLDQFTGGIPVLGIIPAIKTWRDKSSAQVETIANPRSAPSEAYRGVRTSLEFAAVGRQVRQVLVTSSVAGEGKSTTAANLAVSLASAGKEVVLVDCDLRRPRAHQFFGFDNQVGFTTVLLGTTPIDEAAQPVPDIPGLRVLPSGPRPPNPAELLDTDVARSVLALLAEGADYVVIDSPPLIPVSDSAILGAYVDATLLVVEARSTKRRALRRSLELIEQTEAPLLGLVLNAVGSDGTYAYRYDYGDEDLVKSDLGRQFLRRGQDPTPTIVPPESAPEDHRDGDGSGVASTPHRPTDGPQGDPAPPADLPPADEDAAPTTVEARDEPAGTTPSPEADPTSEPAGSLPAAAPSEATDGDPPSDPPPPSAPTDPSPEGSRRGGWPPPPEPRDEPHPVAGLGSPASSTDPPRAPSVTQRLAGGWSRTRRS